ncbi:isoprenylcysteine carboxylmethyltransferase family protein [Aquabacter sp. CN5-332]|uniref:methyltransferase family protein n=1 Tax=Aquabacter sp. CN5-332 TaxID=3156608 RepID=UPI0032B35C0B
MTSPRMVVVGLVSTALFIGLAVLGWNGPAAFFSHPPFVALTIVTFALVVASFFTSGNLDPGLKEDRSNRWVIAALGILGILLAWAPAYTDRNDIWTFGGDGVRWIGVALYAIGGVLRLWPVFTLRRRFSGLVAIQRDHRLETTGIYSLIRHPSYLGMIILSAGWALAFRSGVGLLITAAMLIPILARIHAEEAMLSAQFGSAYEAYRARTWRLIPGLY